MNVLFRHTLRSVKKNKLQAIVIFFTVVAVTMMMFAAFSMTGVFYNINISEYRRTAGTSDMLIGDRSGGAAFAKATVENVRRDNDEIVRVDYFLRGSTIMRGEASNFPVFVEATDLKSFAKPENGFYLVKEAAAGEYPSAFVSERFSEEYSVGLGAVVEILSPISNRYLKFNVTHILETRGFFGSAVANQIVVDLNSVDSMGLVNNAYVTFRDPSLYEKYESEFHALLPTANIENALNEAEVRSIASNNTLLLSVAVVFITVIMMLILFSSYLIIARTRMSEMVLFKAAGASPAQTVMILLSEVLIYGVFGSLLGTILGRIVMGWAVGSLLPYASAAITYEFWKFLASFLLGIVVSVASALVPMLSVAKKSIRDLTQGEVKEVKEKRPFIVILLTLAVAGFAVALAFLDGIAATVVLFLSIPFLVLWLITALRYAVKLISLLLSKIVRKGGGALAAKTSKRSGQILSVSSLVAVIAAFAFMVISTIDVVVVAVTPYHSRFSADIVVSAQDAMTPSEIEALKTRFESIDGVTEISSFGSADFEFSTPNGELLGNCTVLPVSNGKGIFKVSSNADASLKDLFDATERPLVLNYDIAERFGINVGARVLLSWNEVSSNATEKHVLDGAFTVVGIEYTETEWDRVAVMKMSDLVSDGKERAITAGLFIDADRPDAVFRAVRAEAEKENKLITLKYSDWYASSTKGLEGVVTLLRFAEALFALIAALGILNISIVTFLDRKREFTVYRLVGMDSKEYYKFHLAEGGIAALSGCLTGFVAAFFINRLMPVLANLVSKYLAVPLFPLSLIAVPLLTGGIFVLLWFALTAAFEKNFRTSEFKTERSMLQ